MKNQNDFSRLTNSGYLKLDSGDLNEVLEIISELKGFSPNADALFRCSGLLIDLGDKRKNPDFVKEGISILENISFKKLRSEKYYYIGNGFYNLYRIESSKNRINHYFNPDHHIYHAKKNYLMSLHYSNHDLVYFEKNTFMSRLLTNIGNMYDEIGRNIEAIEFYENALKYNPKNAMALGNRGVAIDRYANLMGHYKTTLFLDAIRDLENAISIGVYPDAKIYFENKLKNIKNKIDFTLDDIPKLKPQITCENELEEYIKKYNFENKLFLNLCNYCQRCSNSIKDPALIKIDSKEPTLELMTYFNQIKQEYITARLILGLSNYKSKNLNFVFDEVDLFNTEDSIKKIEIQMLKISFKSFSDIMDKIAQFLNDCLKLGINKRNVSFGHVLWFKDGKIRENIVNSKNPGLNALFDIYLDFKKHGQYEELTEIRNSLTHRIIIISESLEKESLKKMSKETLRKKTINLAKIVRNSIMYLLYFVRIQSRNKNAINL